jgi:hypothetical protein
MCVSTLLLAGCATISPVRPLGDGGYIVIGSYPPWGDAGKVAFARHVWVTGVAYCAAMGKKIKIRDMRYALHHPIARVSSFAVRLHLKECRG